VPTTSVLMLDCSAHWTVVEDFGGWHDIATTATSIEDCRAECFDHNNCTGIDWVARRRPGRQCWLVGPWCDREGSREGIQRHNLNRTCGQQSLYSW